MIDYITINLYIFQLQSTFSFKKKISKRNVEQCRTIWHRLHRIDFKYSSCGSKSGKRRGWAAMMGSDHTAREERHFIFYDRTVQGRRPGSRTWTPLLALMGDNNIVFGLLEDHDSVTCGRPGIGITSCTAAYKRKVGDEGDQDRDHVYEGRTPFPSSSGSPGIGRNWKTDRKALLRGPWISR